MMSDKKTYHAEIVELNGAPTLAVNGKPIFLNAPYLAKASYESFAEVKSEVYFVHDHDFIVDANGNPDIEPMAKQIDPLLCKEPDALVIVRCFLPAPAWWLKQNPDEEMQFDVDLNQYEGHGVKRDVSWGSEPWLQAVIGWYEALCRALLIRYGGRVIGHQFGMGSCGENNPRVLRKQWSLVLF